jgi:hypothetical protein
MKTIRLCVGMQYRTRQGDVVTVESKYSGDIPFLCSDGFWRRVDGTTPGAELGAVDLVEEITLKDETK